MRTGHITPGVACFAAYPAITMTYSVKEIFYTLQGEGANAGSPAVQRLVVLTGGEPLLQVDEALTTALHQQGFRIAVETNGTVAPPPPGLDWICVSPKAGAELKLTAGQELKVVVPQPGLDLDQLAQLPFEHHLLQPMDVAGPLAREHAAWAVARCLADPRWRLSVQTHKTLGIR
jgi:7-carboxy-7-deazaguanine synthase